MRHKLADVRRAFEPPAGTFFLFGPRGTGKTSMSVAAFPDALRIDLLDPATFRELGTRPEALRERLLALPRGDVVVIDEVQRVPALLDVVQQFHGERKDLRFVLTGSSTRKLKQAGVNLLGGRASLCTLHPFMACELGKRFELSKALLHGLLPLVVSSENPANTLRAYLALYVQQEVQQKGRVRDVAGFLRFLEAMSFSHGSLLNVSNVARECMVERRVAQTFVEVLEDLLLATRLMPFTKRAQRATVQGAKFYFFDCGVFRTARPRGPSDSASELDGPALEGLVLQHLRAWNAYRGDPNKLSYWRTRHGVEVDFIVWGPDGFWAIEVKNSARPHARDLSGLKAFREEFPDCTPILLHRGRNPSKIDSIDCLPVGEFLLGIDPATSKLV